MSGLKEQLKQQSEQRQAGEKVTKKVGFREVMPEKKGTAQYWNDEYTFKDNKGWTAKMYLHDIDKQPYEVRLTSPKGQEYIINYTSLKGNDGVENTSKSLAASAQLKSLSYKLQAGNTSVESIAQQYDKYQVKAYPADVQQKVEKQKALNNNIRQKVRKLQQSGNYGMTMCDGVGGEFDSYKQSVYPCGAKVCLTQSGVETTGRENGSYMIGFDYENGSNNVKAIQITDLGREQAQTYNEYLDIDTLVKKGYSPERAQALMNDIANEALNGKPLKDLFKEKLRHLDEPSQNRVQSQMQQRSEQQKKDLGVGYLRKMNQVGGR